MPTVNLGIGGLETHGGDSRMKTLEQLEGTTISRWIRLVKCEVVQPTSWFKLKGLRKVVMVVGRNIGDTKLRTGEVLGLQDSAHQ